LAEQIILHVDLYRLINPTDLFGLGLLDDLTVNTVCLIEWPEHAANLLPKADLACYIDQLGQGRQIRLLAQTDRGKQILKQWELETQ
jgi:tRNA threonylcarbamoyladenosine biosynthesis protein TsaE